MSEEKLVPAVRLATHEIDALMKAHYEQAKLKRLHEVREQAAQFASSIREKGREKRKRVLQGLENKLRDQAEKELKETILDMEGNVMTCLTQFGSAHAKAEQENNANYDEARQADFTRKREKAIRLGKEATKDLQTQKQVEEKKRNEKILSRKQALDTEAVRSAYVVSLPPVNMVPDKPVQEEQPKVLLFDKSTLFQTEYVMKKKVCEPVSSPKDARVAAMLSEQENEKLKLEKEKQKAVNDQKILRRGKEALVREKSHGNYLRLLEELDKMEAGKPDPKWDVESTVTSVDQSCSSSSKPNSPTSTLGHWSDEKEETPVRDICSQVTKTRLAPLATKDSQQLNEIGQLLKELREEQNRWTAVDQAKIEEGILSKSPSNSSSSSSGVVVFSDDDFRIRCGVVENSTSTTSSTSTVDSQRRKDLAKALNALRRERMEPPPPKPTGILRRPVPLTSSATSTPVQKTVDDNRKQVLQYYVRKLLEMKREQVRDLSVGSSSLSTTSTSTPKPTGLAPPSFQPTPEWSKTTIQSSSTSAYDSPATDQSTSKISNASSLPLGAEASAYGRKPPSLPKDDQFSLGPLLDVYNEIYEAYKNHRLDKSQEQTLTESSFMSLTLSTTTSTERSYRQKTSMRSPLSVQLTLSSSSASSTLSSLSVSNTSSRQESRKDWSEMAPTKSSAISSSSSSTGDSSSMLSSKLGQSSTSSQEISMPDVDEALRRLGLPSMQSVLRR